MKKFIQLIVLVVLCFSFTSCAMKNEINSKARPAVESYLASLGYDSFVMREIEEKTTRVEFLYFATKTTNLMKRTYEVTIECKYDSSNNRWEITDSAETLVSAEPDILGVWEGREEHPVYSWSGAFAYNLSYDYFINITDIDTDNQTITFEADITYTSNASESLYSTDGPITVPLTSYRYNGGERGSFSFTGFTDPFRESITFYYCVDDVVTLDNGVCGCGLISDGFNSGMYSGTFLNRP